MLPTLTATGPQVCAALVVRGLSAEGLLAVPTLLSRDRSARTRTSLQRDQPLPLMAGQTPSPRWTGRREGDVFQGAVCVVVRPRWPGHRR